MASHTLVSLAVMAAMASSALLAGALAWKAGLETGRARARDEAEGAVRDGAFAEGRDDGFADGFADGAVSGRARGRCEGHEDGYREGHEDGRRIGRAEALMRVQAQVESLIHPGAES